MEKPQLVVEVINVEFHCYDREEALEGLMFLWANERALPYIEQIERFLTDTREWFVKETIGE